MPLSRRAAGYGWCLALLGCATAARLSGTEPIIEVTRSIQVEKLVSAGYGVPTAANGYITAFRRHSISTDGDNIAVWPLTSGNRMLIRFWPNDANAVDLMGVSAAGQSIVAIGTVYFNAKNAENYLIGISPVSGSVKNVYALNRFKPARITAGTDGTLWVLGEFISDSDASYNLGCPK